MYYWNDENIEEIVDSYRNSRDPFALTQLIQEDYKVMQSPAIGRLFLDIINGKLPPLNHRAESTSEIRAKAVSLVIFYLGSGVKKTKAYAAAGKVLGKSGDTIEGYFNDWLKIKLVWGFQDAISKQEFWDDCESFIGDFTEFIDGKAMVVDSLAESVKPKVMNIDRYRKELSAHYENSKINNFQDPWLLAQQVGLLNAQLIFLKDDDSGE